MDLLGEMISKMDKHAVKYYKVYASRSMEEIDRKDFKLFDFIRKNGEAFDEEKIASKLYDDNKNAYHRLKNRLTQDVAISVFLQNYKTQPDLFSHYLTSMGYYYHSINSYEVALSFFKRAETKSKETENFGLLDIIYSRMIKLARESGKVNPEFYIKKRKENRQMLNRLNEVEDVLEALEYRMKTTQNLSVNKEALPDLLRNTLDEYSRDEELRKSPKVQFGVYYIVSRSLLQNKDYPALERYLEETLKSFNEQKLFNKANHSQKLQLLVWIANAAFKNKNHQLSLKYADLLNEEMQKFDKAYYSQFEFFYYNILVINFSLINPAKAIELLNELIEKGSIDLKSYNGIFVYLNLSLLYFQRKDQKRAIQNIQKLYQNPGFNDIDIRLRLNLNIGEIMIRYDSKEFDIADYRRKQILKDFKDLLGEESQPERKFLNIFNSIIQDVNSLRSTKFRQAVKQLIADYPERWDHEELLFRYDLWLKEKASI